MSASPTTGRIPGPPAPESQLGAADRQTRVTDLDTPAVVVDLDRLDANLTRAAGIATEQRLALRPHVKTHKTLAIARRQLAAGAAGITVSKLDELAGLLPSGAASWLVAYPIGTATKAARLVELQSSTTAEIQVGLDNLTGAAALSAAARAADRTVDVLIEVDSGLGRCGVPPHAAGALAVAVARQPGLRVAGVFTHAGHAYRATDPEALARVAADEAAAARAAAASLRAERLPCPVVSIGSTPTFFTSADRTGITEARPGNYAFFDRTQVALGVATLAECALSVICTVVSTGPGRAVVDAGAKVFGLDKGAHGTALLDGFGEDPESEVRLAWLSEEHGVVADPAGRLSPGDRLRFVPNHACVTANLATELYLIRADRVAERSPIDAPGGGR